MPAELPYSLESGILRLDYGPLPDTEHARSYEVLLNALRCPLRISREGGMLLECGGDFPLLQFVLDLASWCCPHSWWLFQACPGLREAMEHEPGGLGAGDFAMPDNGDWILFGIRRESLSIVIPDPLDSTQLLDRELAMDWEQLRLFSYELLKQLAMQISQADGWDISPLVTRNWRSQLGRRPQRGMPSGLDIPRRLAWQARRVELSEGSWQLGYRLDEIRHDVASVEELPGVVSGGLRLQQRNQEIINLADFPLLEFALTALDWLSDSRHAELHLHRGRPGQSAVWGGYELGRASDGELLLALRRRRGMVELLSADSRARGQAIAEDELGRLLLEFAAQLVSELQARTGWIALALFDREHNAGRAEALPATTAGAIQQLVLGWKGSRSISGMEKQLPQGGQPSGNPVSVNTLATAQPHDGHELYLDIELLDLPQQPDCLADLQEMLRAAVRLRRGSQDLLVYEAGLPLLDFNINCLVWFCRSPAVQLDSSRMADARRRGRPLDFILEYASLGELRFGLRDDIRGYLVVLELGDRPLSDRRIVLSHSEAWVLMFDIAEALVRGVHAKWGWDIRPLYGPQALSMAERPLQKVESIGYMNLERDVRDLSDIRHGIVRGPAGCMPSF